MLHGKKIIVVMPAYLAEKTLAPCYAAIPHDIVDEVLLVDDASKPPWPDMDACAAKVGARLGAPVYRDDQIVVFALRHAHAG
ncbi:MAG: hypothetical protein ACREPX_08285 [Rhodanobacteraceae bacterium]